MKFEDAKKWVDDNKGMLAKQALNYTRYAPYAVNDYLQDAYEAALKAALCCQRNPDIDFKRCFTRIWKDIIASVTPYPDEAREENNKKKAAQQALREGREIPVENSNPDEKKKTYYSGGTSMSYPINHRRDVLENLPGRRSESKPKPDIEKIYKQRVMPLLSKREAEVMELAIGITRDGQLSLSEIAAKMGVSKDTAKEYFHRGLAKAKKGNVIDIKSRLSGKRGAAKIGEQVSAEVDEQDESTKAVNEES